MSDDLRRVTTDRQLLMHATDYLTALMFDRPVPAAPVDDAAWTAGFKEASAIHGAGAFLGSRVVAEEIAPPEPLATWLAGQVLGNQA